MQENITSLSKDQERYANWLNNNIPFLTQLFDFENRSYRVELVERYLSTASQGEIIMTKFALGVWRHKDEFNFNFIDAAKTLDYQNMKVITDWMKEPFWP